MSAHGASPKSNRMDAQGCDTRPPCLQAGEGVRIFCPHPQPLSHPVGAYTNRRARVHKSTDKREPPPYPPARRGNRTRARFPSRSGGNLQEGGNCKLRPRDWYKMHEHTDEVVVNYTCTAGISLLGTTLAIGVYKSSPICLFLACFGRFRLTLPLCAGYTIPAHARRAT
jgi:hypothetical protein